MDGNERRKYRRIAWRGDIRLVIPGADPLDATVADISEIGCCVRTAQAVAPGIPVGIDGIGFEGAGITRYCYPHHGGFRVGIELMPAY